MHAGDEEPLAGTPCDVMVVPAALSLKHTSFEVPRAEHAAAGLPCTFHVALHDQYGNRCAGPRTLLALLAPAACDMASTALGLHALLREVSNQSLACAAAMLMTSPGSGLIEARAVDRHAGGLACQAYT